MIKFFTQNESINTLKISEDDIDNLIEKVQNICANYKQLQSSPVILEIANTKLLPNELAMLIEVLTQNNIATIGIRTKKQELIDFAKILGIAIFKEQSSDKKLEKNTENFGHSKMMQAPKIIQDRIYAFEQVIAKDSDLVILSEVNSGAEILSSGSIFSYQTTKGSLFAGIDGDKDATIFIKNFQAKLISIAGIYKKFDNTSHKIYNKSVSINLNDNKLRFQTL